MLVSRDAGRRNRVRAVACYGRRRPRVVEVRTVGITVAYGEVPAAGGPRHGAIEVGLTHVLVILVGREHIAEVAVGGIIINIILVKICKSWFCIKYNI